MGVGWTSKGPEVGEVGELVGDKLLGYHVSSGWPRPVANVDHR